MRMHLKLIGLKSLLMVIEQGHKKYNIGTREQEKESNKECKAVLKQVKDPNRQATLVHKTGLELESANSYSDS